MYEKITSVNNQIVKNAASLALKKNRQESGLFLIEGLKGVEDAIKSGLDIENIFVLEGNEQAISGISSEKILATTESVMKKISTTDSPTNIIAIAHQPKASIEDILSKENPLIILLEDIKDAGNLGTIIRTALACEADGILLVGDVIDIFNPKVVRSSVGNLWKLPIVSIKDLNEIKTLKNFQIIATVVKQDKSVKLFYDINYKKPTILMLGSEANGLSGELTAKASEHVTIPMNKNVESLNLSIATGIILYETFLQRKLGK